MQSILSTALMGFFLLPGVGQANALAVQPTVAADLPSYSVGMTGYNAVPGQTDSTPDETASGAFSNPEVVAARSQDLADELPFGTVIEIDSATSTGKWCQLPLVKPFIGYRVIADTMNKRMHNKIDILFSTDTKVSLDGVEQNAAWALGLCKNVSIKVVGHVDIGKMPKTQTQLMAMIGLSPLAVK